MSEPHVHRFVGDTIPATCEQCGEVNRLPTREEFQASLGNPPARIVQSGPYAGAKVTMIEPEPLDGASEQGLKSPHGSQTS